MPPPLVLPSPKSPKANPFSSPSPAHNPFMTIVDNNDALWKSMADDKLTADEAAKSSIFCDSKSKKSPSAFTSSFFGGNNNQSSFSSVTSSALAAGTSVFGSSSFGTTGAVDDEGDDEGEEGGGGGRDDDNDGDASPGNGHASMKIISLPENVKLVTGEEEDQCLLQLRSKLYRLNANIPSAVVAPPATSSASASASATSSSSVEKANNGEADSQASASAAVAAASVLEAVAESAKFSGTSSVTQKEGNKSSSSSGRVEWVEVGIGPLKILSRRSSSGEGGGCDNNSNNSNNGTVGRLVMRREEKQGGIGEMRYS